LLSEQSELDIGRREASGCTGPQIWRDVDYPTWIFCIRIVPRCQSNHQTELCSWYSTES